MEEVLHNRVIGQEEAVTAISRAIRRARVGLKNPNRPIASFIFSGGCPVPPAWEGPWPPVPPVFVFWGLVCLFGGVVCLGSPYRVLVDPEGLAALALAVENRLSPLAGPHFLERRPIFHATPEAT